ncbi:hypothetical protein [Streptomyces sp. NPDC047000]|uniref:hypothetical protein n=1 Tax=Streptomyces sp. NPDC047000 TaxID=3155474 RepID=UPI0033DD0D06
MPAVEDPVVFDSGFVEDAGPLYAQLRIPEPEPVPVQSPDAASAELRLAAVEDLQQRLDLRFAGRDPQLRFRRGPAAGLPRPGGTRPHAR